QRRRGSVARGGHRLRVQRGGSRTTRRAPDAPPRARRWIHLAEPAAGDGLARDGLPERRDRAARAAARGRGSGERAAAGGGERRRPAQAFAGLAASGGPAHGCWLLTETISPVM